MRLSTQSARFLHSSCSVQTSADQGHGRQRQKDIRSEGKVDAGQEVGPDSHHGAKERDADGNRDPLARGYEACSEPFWASGTSEVAVTVAATTAVIWPKKPPNSAGISSHSQVG